ncbi:hypothetical protein TEA_003191 [Camellia sinensis var. sinensis]|uniref:Uncharacterized protein n=1 Tax=Camellia sinensis var. sinensis TaxID=542762 RepID=A0A4S4EEE9_CAMSN|nr:hypothetical protein TEA_003191 [Camellia sinensis var. sinensis]
MEAMMQPQQGKKRGQKKQSKSRPEAIITQDVPMNSSRQLEFPNTGRSSEPETLTASLNLPESSETQPDYSVPEKPMVLDLDLPMNSEQQTELPNSVECQRPEIRTVETISRAEEQQAVTAALDLPK